jgi:FkbM family methyltransferase
VGEDISFDLALIRRFGMRVHAFDPTPRSIAWVQSQTVPPEFNFHDFGIAAVDGSLTFHAPDNPDYVSYSVVRGNASQPRVDAPVRRLSTIMKMLQHQKIDVLKMDIEGAEYEVLRDMLESTVPVEQLLVEFHHRWTVVGLDKTRNAVRKVMEAGFKIFNISATGEEYSFIRI